MKTRRLFEENPYQTTFQANVLESREEAGKIQVVLDQTLFYPTSGGQPCDRGTIQKLPVTDVLEEGEVIVHVLEKALEKSTEIEGEIHWKRRFGHMQQHSGQHILSQALYRIAKAETVGFHLGEENSTIDVDAADFPPQRLNEIEQMANDIVFENRPILVSIVPVQELKSIPLRKCPEDKGDVRVVQVEGFDWSGCCGTHVKHTGEVGIIKITRTERYKGGMRIGFLCGQRALKDYREKQNILRETCQLLTSGEEEVVSILTRWQEDRKTSSRRIRSLTEEVLTNKAPDLLGTAEQAGPYKLIVSLLTDYEFQDIQTLVKKLIQNDDTITLIGLKKDRGYLCFGRSQSVDIDMRPILSEACSILEGKGGGSPFMAQGNGPEVIKIESALQKARTMLLQIL
jgi:alanyl-tRNA synthetase